MKTLKFILLGLLFHSSVAAAADNEARFAMKGAGFLPCQTFTKAREDRSTLYYMIGGWVEGYVSAHNRYARDTFDILSFESLELLMSVIQNHCRTNPKDRLHGVLNGLLVSLAPDRLRAVSPRVQITDGDRQTALRRETIRRIQSRLQKRGLYQGAIDGRFTDATRSALIAFQSDLDFETTGFPDQTTLWRLLRN